MQFVYTGMLRKVITKHYIVQLSHTNTDFYIFTEIIIQLFHFHYINDIRLLNQIIYVPIFHILFSVCHGIYRNLFRHHPRQVNFLFDQDSYRSRGKPFHNKANFLIIPYFCEYFERFILLRTKLYAETCHFIGNFEVV